MDDHNHKPDDPYFDPRTVFNAAERDCIRNIEDEDDLLERLHDQREVALQRLWSTFQIAASSLAQLYKERASCDCCDRCLYKHNNHDRWQPFQGSANKVTLLYRDGSEALRAGIELGYHAGYQKRNRDITSWVKKKRRNIRREDILLNLSGRSPPRRKGNDSRANSISLSPKPMSPTNDLLTFNDTKEFDFNSLLADGRNPFAANNNDGRKRHSDLNITESPHKRGRFN